MEELVGITETEMDVFTDEDLAFINAGWNTTLDSFPNNNLIFPTTNAADHFLPFDHYAPFGLEISPPHFPLLNLETQTLPYLQQDYYSMSFLDDEETAALFGNPDTGAPCKVETVPAFDPGFCPRTEGKNKLKKLNGQPSKNLMAERRRRKRLNDRLSMLRSVVPKISKMDRTSILGDTIDYMKELLDRINNLQEEMHLGSNDHQLSLINIFKPNDILLRNSPKFEVERKNEDTRIEISCVGKPGLLVSTVSTLEELGLEIQHCVVSCFNDFALQASCSQDLRKSGILESEDIIKEALLRNAGYGGRCV